MKKLIASAFLLIHLFNLGGALLMHQFLVYRSDRLFDEQISKNNYSIDDLTEIKIPANLPSITDWKDYESMNGSVRFQNTAYNYVKIKVTRTAIYLMCIPNYNTTRLVHQNIIDARQIPDIPVTKKDHVPFGKINLTTYNYQPINYSFSNTVIPVNKTICHNHLFIPNSSISGPGQPPDMGITLS